MTNEPLKPIEGAEPIDNATSEPLPPSEPGPDRARFVAQSIALKGESEDLLWQLIVSLYSEFSPESPIESQLVETMAVARWRQMRLWCLEKVTVSNAVQRSNIEGSHATRTALALESLASESRWTEQMSRAEHRLEQQYRRSIQAFREHRAWRRAPGQADQEKPDPKTKPNEYGEIL